MDLGKINAQVDIFMICELFRPVAGHPSSESRLLPSPPL